MKILARWSVVLSMALTVGFTAVETKVEATPTLANYSQENSKEVKKVSQTISVNKQQTLVVNKEQTPVFTPTNSSNSVDDKKLVKKTVMVSARSAARSFRATAYCLKGRTATGAGVRRGLVAADKRLLPLGTKIYIDAGAYSGIYTVADTGGAVKGNILDVWVPSCSEANRFGRKSISVSIIN